MLLPKPRLTCLQDPTVYIVYCMDIETEAKNWEKDKLLLGAGKSFEQNKKHMESKLKKREKGRRVEDRSEIE